MKPPDGHWHVRTKKPAATKQVPKLGLVEKYTCQTKGCEWAVYEAPRGGTYYAGKWNRLTPLGITQRMYAENADPKKEAKARKLLGAAETVSGLMPDDPEYDL